jgi:hypothetical protein
VPKVKLHRFRDTFITNKLRDGVDVRTVQRWAGPEDVNVTMGYAAWLDGQSKAAGAAQRFWAKAASGFGKGKFYALADGVAEVPRALRRWLGGRGLCGLRWRARESNCDAPLNRVGFAHRDGLIGRGSFRLLRSSLLTMEWSNSR